MSILSGIAVVAVVVCCILLGVLLGTMLERSRSRGTFLRAYEHGVEDGKNTIRCPACGTLESCGCASPGWTYIHKDVEAQGLQLLPDKRVAAPKGVWLDDQGRIVVITRRKNTLVVRIKGTCSKCFEEEMVHLQASL